MKLIYQLIQLNLRKESSSRTKSDSPQTPWKREFAVEHVEHEAMAAGLRTDGSNGTIRVDKGANIGQVPVVEDGKSFPSW